MPESKVVGFLQPATLLKEILVDFSKKFKIASLQKACGCLLLELPVFIETFDLSEVLLSKQSLESTLKSVGTLCFGRFPGNSSASNYF